MEGDSSASDPPGRVTPAYPPPPPPLPFYPPDPPPPSYGTGRAYVAPSPPGHVEPPRTPAQGGVWFAIAVVGFLVGQVLSAILLYVVAAANGQIGHLSNLVSRTVPPAWVVICGLVGLWMGFVGAVVFASRTQGTRNVRRDMRLDFKAWDLIIGPVVGALGQLALLPLLYLPLEPFISHLSKRLSEPAKHLTGGFPGSDLALIAFLTVVIVPVVEETFFRGLVLRGLLRAFGSAGRLVGPALACVVSGIAFGLAHFELLQLLGLSGFGVVLSVMAYKLGRLGPCIFAHATFNLLAVLVVAYPTGFVH